MHNEKDLIKSLKNLSTSKDILRTLHKASKIVNSSNAHIILAFLFAFQDANVIIEPFYVRSVKFHIDALKQNVMTKIPNPLKEISKKLKKTLFKVASSDNSIAQEKVKKEKMDIDLYEEIKALITDTLLKYSSKEIENILVPPKKKKQTRNILDENLYVIEEIKDIEKKKEGIVNFIRTLSEEDLHGVLKFYIKSKKDAELVFLCLFILNKNLYEKMVNIIFNESFFMRTEFVRALPFFELFLEKEDVREDILKLILETKPIFREKIIAYLLKFNRRDSIIRIAKDHYSLFNIESLNLTMEEHIILCETNNSHVFMFFDYIPFFDNEDLAIYSFAEMLSKMEDIFILSFLQFYFPYAIELYYKIIVIFLKLKKLSKELQTFFIGAFVEEKVKVAINDENNNQINVDVEDKVKRIKLDNENIAEEMKQDIDNFDINLSNEGNIPIKERFMQNKTNFEIKKYNREIFYLLIMYLNKNILINKMEEYLNDEDSLRNYLKVLSPFEIFYNIHYFKEIENSLKVSQMIRVKKEIFSERVCFDVIRAMEERTLPPLFMRTVILSLQSFPSMKGFVIDLLFRLVKREIWIFPRLFDGFIRCIGILGNSAIEVLMSLPEEQLNVVLCNEKILNMCHGYVKNNVGLKGRCAFILKNCVYKVLKNHNK